MRYYIKKYLVGEGLDYLSNGSITFHWDLYSNITCKLRFFLYFLTESFSHYLLVWLTIERLLIFYQPFSKRLFFTKRNGIIFLIILIFLSIFISSPTLIVFQVSTHQNSFSNITCKGVYKSTTDVVIFILFTCILCEFLPQISVLICTLLLGYKLYQTSKSNSIPMRVVFRKIPSVPPINKKLQSTPSANQVQRIKQKKNKKSLFNKNYLRNDLKLVRSIYILALLELIITFFSLLPWIVIAIVELTLFGYSEELIVQLFAIGYLINDLMVIIRLWNIYIYYLTIPSFKEEVNRIFCCIRTTNNINTVPRPSLASRERSDT